MKTTRLVLYAALVSTSVLVAGSSLWSPQQDPEVRPDIPSNPMAEEVRLVEARRFTVGEKIVHAWRRDGLQYDSGWLLVLEAAPGLILPRQTYEPVLYVGAQTADRVHASEQSGRVVAIVPGDFLLTDVPIFFGAPALPEELGQTEIDAALQRAVDAGVVPPSLDAVARAVDPTPLHVADHYQLRQRAVDLVEKHSPQATDFIRGARAPLIR